MDAKTLETVAQRFPWASWAVWDEAFPDGDCVEDRPSELVDFMKQDRTDLTPGVILLGLNRADTLPAPFANFHAPSRKHYDYRLKEFIQERRLSNLHGAYMTDLVDTVDPDSQRVTVTDDDARVFHEQLRLLDQQEYQVLCFGNKPFDGLVDYYDVSVSTTEPELKRATVHVDEWTLHLNRLWFYGLYGVYQNKVEVLKRQLEQVNEWLS